MTARRRLPLDPTRAARIDAGGTAWRLRSLVAMGHDCARIADALSVGPALIRRIVRGDTATITPALRDLARQLWDAWWDKTPAAADRLLSDAQPPSPCGWPNSATGPPPQGSTRTCSTNPATGRGAATGPPQEPAKPPICSSGQSSRRPVASPRSALGGVPREQQERPATGQGNSARSSRREHPPALDDTKAICGRALAWCAVHETHHRQPRRFLHPSQHRTCHS